MISVQFLKLISDDSNLKIKTDHLMLEPIIEDHAEVMWPLLQDSSLYMYIPQNPPTMNELKKRYQMWSQRKSPDESEIWLNWVARNRLTCELIGQFQAGFDEKNGFSVAYTIAKPYQRQAYATEGLSAIIGFLRLKMQAQNIKAWVDTRNEASIRLMQRLGFEQTQLIKNADEFKGTASDEFVFELKTKK